jgi:hypothetical protein
MVCYPCVLSVDSERQYHPTGVCEVTETGVRTQCAARSRRNLRLPVPQLFSLLANSCFAKRGYKVMKACSWILYRYTSAWCSCDMHISFICHYLVSGAFQSRPFFRAIDIMPCFQVQFVGALLPSPTGTVKKVDDRWNDYRSYQDYSAYIEVYIDYVRLERCIYV